MKKRVIGGGCFIISLFLTIVGCYSAYRNLANMEDKEETNPYVITDSYLAPDIQQGTYYLNGDTDSYYINVTEESVEFYNVEKDETYLWTQLSTYMSFDDVKSKDDFTDNAHNKESSDEDTDNGLNMYTVFMMGKGFINDDDESSSVRMLNIQDDNTIYIYDGEKYTFIR